MGLNRPAIGAFFRVPPVKPKRAPLVRPKLVVRPKLASSDHPKDR
jgi:hypothetical protein